MENLDLTLSLGLPKNNQEIDYVQPNPFLSLAAPRSQGTMKINGENSENRSHKAENGAISNVNVNLMVSSLIMKQFSTAPIPDAIFLNNIGGSQHELNANLATAKTLGNDYVLLDVPPRRAERELAAANGYDANAVAGRGGTEHVNKRCTNYNCHTSDTPMWRRGPLGPKTLCNACGIKYRKEEEKKKAREAASREKSYRMRNGQVGLNLTD